MEDVSLAGTLVHTAAGDDLLSAPAAVLAAVRANCPVVDLTAQVHDRALTIAETTNLNIYDATIVAAAATHGCNLVYSEDLNHGQTVDGVRITNPFKAL